MPDDDLTDSMTQPVPLEGGPGEESTPDTDRSVESVPGDEGEETVSPESSQPRYRRFDLLTETEAAIEAARAAVAAGECIVMPTDTVYGIGANAFSADAVQGLLDAKGRGRDMPPPVLISEPGMLDALGANVSTFARRLAEKFWPGALTLVVEMQSSLRLDLGETGGTIALRVPDHDAARSLLRRTGPLAVSSANASGHPSATTVDEAIAQLGDSVSVYLDAGPTPGPVSSTIVEFVSDPAGVVLREGVISFETISDVAPLVTNAMPRHAAEEPEGDSTGTDPDEVEPSAESTGGDLVGEVPVTGKHAVVDAAPAPEDPAEG